MPIRTKEQLAVMLKLIKVNELSLNRRNLSVRQKIWNIICQKLNAMRGAKKDVDGWKRSYTTWRINAGSDYNSEVEKVIKHVADDDYFCINVSEDEVESESDNDFEPMDFESPSDLQKIRLHELVSKHGEILNSNADDEPLKSQIWLNISEELNATTNGTLKLTPNQWKKRVDWDRYKVRKKRKALKGVASPVPKKYVKRFNSINSDQQRSLKNVEFEVLDHLTCESQDATYAYEQDDLLIDELIVEEPELASTYSKIEQNQQEQTTYNFAVGISDNIEDQLNDRVDDFIEEINDEDSDHHDDDDVDVDNEEDDDEDNDDYTEIEFKPQPPKKLIKPTPIVKSYKYSKRIVSAVERLGTDVSDMKDLLKKTTQALECLENVMQQQCHKQDETNALLRRNEQLLKMLVTQNGGINAKSTKSKLN